MKISAELLFERLAELLPVRGKSHDMGNVRLSGVMFHQTNSVTKPGMAYLAGKSSPMLHAPGIAIVYFGGFVPPPAARTWISVDAPAEETMNALLEIFDSYSSWEESLSTVAFGSGRLSSLLSLSYKMIGNPIIILNPDFSVRVTIGENAIPPAKQVFNEDVDNFEIITAFRQNREYTDNRLNLRPYLISKQVLPFRSLNVNLFRQEIPIGMIMVAENNRPLRDTDEEFLAVIARYAGFILEQEYAVERSMDGPTAVLYRMLTDSGFDYDEALHQLDSYGWSEEEQYLCAYFVTDPGSISDSENLRISYRLREMYPGSSSFPLENAIVCFISLSKLGKTADNFFSDIKLFVRDNNLRTGYSRILQGKSNLKRQFRQARFALEGGRKQHPFKWIFSFDDYIYEFIKSQVLNGYPPEMVCHPGLLELNRHDQLNKTEYMPTLKALLDCNMNTSVAARNLFIHRSTLLYRMDKIKAIMCSTLEDPDELLYIGLSYRLMTRE